MHTVEKINFAFMCLFFACYLYQFLYIPVSWRSAKTSGGQAPLHRFAVLTADNVLDRNFFATLNVTFSWGYDIVTCYRNSKNYGDNWISAGYGLWFLRESRYLNQARQGGGWPFHLLTEDIEFTIDNVVRGVKIGYCPEAILYDEQPVDFRQSWAQRLRWSQGYLQVFRRYGGCLFVTPEWTPIRRTRALSPRQICGEFREDAG